MEKMETVMFASTAGDAVTATQIAKDLWLLKAEQAAYTLKFVQTSGVVVSVLNAERGWVFVHRFENTKSCAALRVSVALLFGAVYHEAEQ